MLNKLLTLTLATFLVAGLGSVAWAQPQDSDGDGEISCEEARCAFQQRILEECNCETADNHGRFVSCAAHLIKDLEAEGMPRKCHGKLQRCAARSVCGKQDRGFHTCTRVQYGTCVTTDTLSGTGACEHDPTVVCTTNTDCVVSSRCKTTRRPETCEDTAAGEFLDLAPTCCSTCSAPPE